MKTVIIGLILTITLSSAVHCFDMNEHFDSYEDFLTEYYSQDTKNAEVLFLKNIFPDIDTHLTTEQYQQALEEFLHKNVSELENIDEEVAKIHKDHNEVLTRAYLEQRGKTVNGPDVYELKDAYHDIIEGDFMFYLDTVEVKTPKEIEDEEKIQAEVDKEIDAKVKAEEEAEAKGNTDL